MSVCFDTIKRLATRTLLVIDRATGETERISDGNMPVSIAHAAHRIGLSLPEAVDLLLRGEELATCGFIRKLEAYAAAGPIPEEVAKIR